MLSMLRLIVIGIAALVLAGLAWIDSAVNVFASSVPTWTAGSIGAHPLSLVERNDRLTEGDVQDLPEALVINSAKEAIKLAPLNATAIRHLSGRVGFQTEERPEGSFLELSEKVTRRDRETQLGLLLNELLQGDASSSFAHLDRLLTVRPGMVSTALPQLVALLEIEDGRELYLANVDRPWFIPFMQRAMTAAADPAPVADFYESLDRMPTEIESEDLDKFAGRLADKGFYDRAVNVASRRQVKQPALSEFEPDADTVIENLVPLTWKLASDVAGGADLVNKGLVDIQLDPGGRIVALERVFRPDSKASQLEMLISQQTGNVALIKWSIQCLEGGNWKTNWESGWFRAEQDMYEIALPKMCATPRWRLEAQAGEGQRSSNFRLRLGLD